MRRWVYSPNLHPPKGLHPAKALRGDNDGDGNGAEGDSPASVADQLPGRDDPMDGSGTGGGGGPNPPDGDDDPSEPGDHESGPDSEYYAPADCALPVPESRLPASVGGVEEGPGQGAFFTPIRLTLLRMPLLLLCGKACRRISFSSCWTMLQQLTIVSANTTGISCQRPFCLTQ